MSGVGVVQREQLGPGGQVQGELDDRQPDPVLVEALQGEVGQAGVLGDADPVFATGPAPVAPSPPAEAQIQNPASTEPEKDEPPAKGG